MEKSLDVCAAERLVLAYLKAWSWSIFENDLKSATDRHAKDFKFLPDSPYWSGQVTVRSYVAQNWPKLNAYLDGPATIEKKIKAASEIIKLKWNGERPKGSLTDTERREIDKSKKAALIVVAANKISRDRFKNASLHDWSTCK